MLELVALLLSLANPPDLNMLASSPLWTSSSFRPAERAVDNWRSQAALDLDLTTETALRWLAGNTPVNLPRCIRLNNYWCIKQAGWRGEIAADNEGHAAFASAEEGAVVAVQLLRRYYLEYGRKSARVIIAHWAPAQCDMARANSAWSFAAAPRLRQTAVVLPGLAKRGIGNTLRARWLAAHGRGGTTRTKSGAGKIAVKRSVVPDHLGAMRRAPPIAAGLGRTEPPLQGEAPLKAEPPLRGEPLRLASLSPPAPASPFLASPPSPIASCASESARLDSARLANYAARAIEGITRSSDDDLKLFASDGTPLPPVARLLANMAGIEIGPYRADSKLIEAAIEAVRIAPAPQGRRGGS